MDRRQKKTRRAVFQAFTALLEKKPYAAITVQEIIDGADIGRSTFYAHFETKDDLLKALCTEIFAHIFSHHLTRESSHDFSESAHDLSAEITHLLYHLQDSRSYLPGILAGESSDIFMRCFKEYLKQVFEGAIAGLQTDIPKDYLLNHIICDFAETVRWWMRNPRYTPEEIRTFFLAAVRF